MDEQGQLSVEVILFVAIILFIVLGVGVFANEQSVKNSIATATRFGAENGTTEMGISNPGTLPVKVNSIQMNGTEKVTIHLSRAVTQSEKNAILKSVQRSLSSQGYSGVTVFISY
ncbi:MAG TPA: class III signal peptide-containing protein [Methanothermobacter sp.]|nr:class III signal peptide-containing protein [Methanothermobacter sp.]